MITPSDNTKKKSPTPDYISKLYLSKCTEEGAFINKKLNKSYFALRKHFEKEKLTALDSIMVYLQSIEDKEILALGDVYKKAEEHRRKKIEEHNKNLNLSVESKNEIKYTVDKFIML